jgi:EmrB/QacA subfamily drug resistance transporter
MTLAAELRAGDIRLRSTPGRGLLVATILGSAMVFVDGTVVNIALPTLGRELHGTEADLQWTVASYTLTVAAFLLTGGAISDRFGRRRTFLAGVNWFAVASLACALAPSVGALVVFRGIQGMGGALLTPGALALIRSVIHPDDRSKAVGTWSGLAGAAATIGPLAGGWLIEAASWRWIFLINLPIACVVVIAVLRHVPETREQESRPFDFPGAALGALALAAITYALAETDRTGDWWAPQVVLAAAVGTVAIIVFSYVERHSRVAMVPQSLFQSPIFKSVNWVTLITYGALGTLSFLLSNFLQVVGGYTALDAGLAGIPATIMMMLLSPRVGVLAGRVKPRVLIAAGGVLTATGSFMLAKVGPPLHYWIDILPALLVFSSGMASIAVSVTLTVLSSSAPEQAGIASGVNNSVARAAAALAVTLLPLIVGLHGRSYMDPIALGAAFRKVMLLDSLLFACAALTAWVGIRDPHAPPRDSATSITS